MEGTVLVRFKTAFISALNTALTDNSVTAAAAYDSPKNAEEALGSTGDGCAAWFADEAEANHSTVALLAGPKWFDEETTPRLRIQAVGSDTDHDQTVVDTLANTVLGYAIAVIAEDPTLGLTNDTIQDFQATPVSWNWTGGVVGTNQRIARFELVIGIEARLKLVIP